MYERILSKQEIGCFTVLKQLNVIIVSNQCGQFTIQPGHTSTGWQTETQLFKTLLHQPDQRKTQQFAASNQPARLNASI